MVLLAAVVSSWAGVSCRDDPPPQAPSTAGSSSPVRVTGTERIVWDQDAHTAKQLHRYRYIVYIDDEPMDLIGARCDDGMSNGAFLCAARLPKMLPGVHRLQLAIEEIDGQKRQSPKSSAITLEVVTSKTAS